VPRPSNDDKAVVVPPSDDAGAHDGNPAQERGKEGANVDIGGAVNDSANNNGAAAR